MIRLGGLRPAPVPIGGRSSRPPAEREALNFVLDVLAQLLEEAFDVLGRAVIGNHCASRIQYQTGLIIVKVPPMISKRP